MTSPQDQTATSKYTDAERTQPDPGRTEYVPEGMGKWSRVAAIVFVVLTTAFWIFVFSPKAREIFQATDEVVDVAYVEAIMSRCDAAVAEMDLLPSIRSAQSPEERAIIVDEANLLLEAMQSDIAQLAGGQPDDRRLVGLWLDDWDFYLEDRMVHADKLRNGEDTRFLNTERDGVFIAERMSGFARRNFARKPELAACLPPGDL